MHMQRANQSNPFSTGGGGVNYEVNVQTYYAACMLMGNRIPHLNSEEIVKIKLQGHYDGFDTDDCIIYGKDGRKLLCQIKHSIKISENNNTFNEVIESAWNDYLSESFVCDRDELTLIVNGLSVKDIESTLYLFRWARSCASAEEFVRKVNQKGFSSGDKNNKYRVIVNILNRLNNNECSNEQIWGFFSHFSIQILQLDNPETALNFLLADSLNKFTGRKDFVNSLYRYIADLNQNAGTITKNMICEYFNLSEVLNDMSEYFREITYHNSVIMGAMNDSICGITIQRDDILEGLEIKTQNNDVVLVTGQRGIGKTGIVRQYIDKKSDCQLLLLRAEELNENCMRNVLSLISPNMSQHTMDDLFFGYQECYIIIESLERVLENEHQGAFCELLSYVSKKSGWKIIATVRDYAVNQIIMNFLSRYPLNFAENRITVLTDGEIEYVLRNAKIPHYEIIGDEVKQLAKIPIFLDLIIRSVMQGYSLSSKDSKNTIMGAIWSMLIENNSVRRQGLPERRKNLFIRIAVERAKKSMYMVPEDKYDYEILNLLESDGLIVRTNGMVAIAHDVLEDIALEKWIEQTYIKSQNLIVFYNEIGLEQTICRAYRLWLIEKFKNEQFALEYISRIFAESGNKEFKEVWLDETIAALLTNDSLDIVLNNLSSILLHSEVILEKILFMMRVVSKRPDESLKNMMLKLKPTEKSSFIILRPYGKCWEILFAFLEKYKAELSCKMTIVSLIIQLLIDWKKGITIQNDMVEGARNAGLLALYFLKKCVEETAYDFKIILELFEVAMVSFGSISNEFTHFIEETILDDSKRQKVSYIDKLAVFLLTDFSCCYIAKYNSQLLIDVAKKEWLFNEQQEWGNRRLYKLYENDLVRATGFSYNGDFSYDQPSGLREPFRSIFAYAPNAAFDFLSYLCNHFVISNNKYICEQTEINPLDKLSFILSNGKVVEQYSSYDLWVAYRGFSRGVPGVLQCGLMAMENYLIDYFNDDGMNSSIFEPIVNKVMELSNSVLTTAVLASIGLAYESRLGISLIPILEKIDCLNFDFSRCCNEFPANYKLLIPTPKENWFINERKKANSYAWRTNCLDNLFVKYQFSTYRSRLLESVDMYSKECEDPEKWLLRKRKIDTREFVTESKKDDHTIVLTSKPLDGELQRKFQANELQYRLLSRCEEVHKWEEKERNSDEQIDSCESKLKTILKELKDLYEILHSPENSFIDVYEQSIMNTMAIVLKKYRNYLESEDLNWISKYLLDFINDKLDNSKSILNNTPIGFPFLIELIPSCYDIWGVKEVKELLIKAIVSNVKEINVAAAKAISRSLWSKDRKLAEELLQIIVLVDDYTANLRKGAKRQNKTTGSVAEQLPNLIANIHMNEIKFQDLVRSKFHSIIGTALLLTAVPASQFMEFKDVICTCIHKIIEVEKKKENYKNVRDYDIDYFYSYSAVISEALGYLFYNCSEEELLCIKEDISNLALEAPQVMMWVLITYKNFCEKDKHFDYYWAFYRLLNDSMVMIAQNLNYKNNYQFNDQSKVLSEYCYINYNWKSLDYKNKPIESGCDDICIFSKKVLNNPIVYTGIASLMFHFPDLILDKGIEIHDVISEEELVANFKKDANAVYFMENNMHAYLIGMNEKTINYCNYLSCIKILNALIVVASSKAYYLREYLIKTTKRIKN